MAGIADARQLLADRCAVDAPHRVGLLECKAADIDQASHRIGWKARSLFIGEGDERQWPARGSARVIECLACFEARHHPVKPVLAAPPPHPLHVTPTHTARQLPPPLTPAD